MSPHRLTALVLTLGLLGVGEGVPLAPAQADKGTVPAARADLHGDPLPPGALARMGTVRFRHGGNVFFVAFLPDGNVLTAGHDSTARLWDPSGKPLRHFDLPQEQAQAMRARFLGESSPAGVAVSADGKVLAAADSQQGIRLWDIRSGEERKPITEAKSLQALALSPDGKAVAATGMDGMVTIWDTMSGKELRQLNRPPAQVPAAAVGGGGGFGGFGGRFSYSAWKLAYSPDGKRLAATTEELDPTGRGNQWLILKVWDVTSRQELNKLRWPAGYYDYYTFAFSPDSTQLAWWSPEGVLHLEHAATGKPIRYFKGEPFSTWAFAPDGKTLFAAAAGAKAISRWETETGKELAPVALPPASSPSSLVMSQDGKRVAWPEGYGVHLMELATGKALHGTDGHRASVSSVWFAPEGKRLTSLAADGTIRTWDALTGKELGQVAIPANASSPLLSPDGKTLAYLNRDPGRGGPVVLADAATGKVLHTITLVAPGGAAPAGFGGFRSVPSFIFTSDGKGLVVNYGLAVGLYDVATGKELRSFELPAAPERALPGRGGPAGGGGPAGFGQFQPGGMGGAPGVRTLPTTFLPGGKHLIVQKSSQQLDLYSIAAGRMLCQLPLAQGQRIVNVAVSPDDRTVALDTGDGLVTLFETATSVERGHLGKKLDAPKPADPRERFLSSRTAARMDPRLVWSPDGRLLAGAEGTRVHLWDVVAGQELGKFEGQLSDALTLAFSSDGSRLASGSRDGNVLVWDVSALRTERKPPATDLPARDIEARWAALAGADAAKAFAAINDLAAAPRQAVPFLKERLKPASLASQQVEKWIAALDSINYAEREQATGELKALGPPVEPALRKALAGNLTAEARRRLEALLAELVQEVKVLSAEELRTLRAIEVLERLGTAEAKEVLQVLAGGALGAPTTAAAKAALERARR